MRETIGGVSADNGHAVPATPQMRRDTTALEPTPAFSRGEGLGFGLGEVYFSLAAIAALQRPQNDLRCQRGRGPAPIAAARSSRPAAALPPRCGLEAVLSPH
jgi:hypothetical protein